MTIEYKIEESDFLTYQLFVASKSDRINKRRQRSKTLFPLIYITFGILGLVQGNISMAVIFLIIAALWFVVYPVWERQHYIKHYLGFIRENYKSRIDKYVSLHFSRDFILAKDEGSESKISTSEIEKISEIHSAIYITLKGGQSFIISKCKINDWANLTLQLKELANHVHINYEKDEKWKWK